MMPDDRKYTKSHEWLKIEGDFVVVGITDYAQEALGDITYVEMPEIGKTVDQAGECGVIESVKVASDILAPVAGEVAEVNSDLEAEPELVNRDPYGKGWILKLKNIDAGQVAGLMDEADYEAMTEDGD